MALEVERLRAGYGHVEVLHEVTIHADDKECIAIFGPNGHGKTTLFRALSGLIRVQDGSMRLNGRELRGLGPREIVEVGLVHVPQGSVIFPTMTVEECLDLGAYSSRSWKTRRSVLAEVYGLFPRLEERRSQTVSTLSGGERQMLAMGMGLMARPSLLLLDEPTMGLAPLRRMELAGAIQTVAETGVTMVIVDQDLELLFSVANRLYSLERGRIVREVPRGEMLSKDELVSLYFGEEGT